MSHLWVPRQHRSDQGGTFPSLPELRENKEWFRSAQTAYTKAISASFATVDERGHEQIPRQIQASEGELKRRMDILYRWTERLRFDHHYSLPRIFQTDVLARALRAEIEGEDFVPSDRTTWRRPNHQGDETNGED